MTEVKVTPNYRITDRESVAAFAVYLGLSLFFFGRALIGHFGDRYIGIGPDPAPQMFFLAWLPHAIQNHLNPLFTKLAWAPSGLNLTRSTTMIPAAIAIAPITLLLGLVRAYNTLMLLAPALAAWPAFVLCRRLCGGFWPALLAGYMFGFSPFMLAHLLGHTCLVLIGLIPLAVYLVALRLDNEIGARRFASLMTVVLLGQFGCSLETLATMSFFGGIALALAWRMGDADLRARLTALLPPLACAYAATIAISSPYLYYFFTGARIEMDSGLPIITSADPMNVLIPTTVNALGALGLSRLLAPKTNIYEMSAFIGLPMIIVTCAALYRRGNPIAIKLSATMLAIATVLSFGPVVVLGSRHVIPMPGIFFLWMPLLKYAMPGRFAVFSFLCLGVLFALWLSDYSYKPITRIFIAALVLISFTPNLNARFWTTADDTPEFFRNGIFREYLSPDENVLIMPYGYTGNSDLWQAETHFYFRMAGGYLGITPPVPDGYREWPIVDALYSVAEIPDLDRQVKAFLVNKRVSKIIVPDGGAHLLKLQYGDGPATWRLRPFNADERAAIHAFFDPIDPAPIHVGGVTIYRVPLDRLSSYAQYTPERLQTAVAHAKLRTLVAAANEYLAQGRDPATLNLDEAARLNLFPRSWLIGPVASGYPPQAYFLNGLVMRPDPTGGVMIGLRGSQSALQTLDGEYARYCRTARILAPRASPNLAEWTQPILMLDLDRAGLRAAAAADARSAIVSAR